MSTSDSNPAGKTTPAPTSMNQPGLAGETAEVPEQDIIPAETRAFFQQRTAQAQKPTVFVPGGTNTITNSAESLFKAIAPSHQLFYRGGLVVELVHEAEGPIVGVLDAVAAQSRFEKFVQFKKQTPDNLLGIPTTISEAIAKQYLRSEACRTQLPKLNGILHCPILIEKADGTLHQIDRGYDATTGFYVAAGQAPTSMSLEEAINFLTGLLADFDFLSPGDHARAIASLITPALKFGGLIKGNVPVDVAEANASQSGKTYRQKLIAAIYNQKVAQVTKRSGGVGSMEEMFGDHLIKGRVFIQFDNVRGKLDSQYLEAFLTSGSQFSARIPYHGNVVIDPSKHIVFISSNGFEATKDLTNRASIIRIRKREGYQFRTLDGKDMLQLAYEWQNHFTGALFAVVREWHRRGKPRTNETRHDFREWCQALDWIVQNIFKLAPLMEGHEEAKLRAANPQLTFLRSVAIKLNEQNQLGQQKSASDIADLCIESDLDIPGLEADNQTIEAGRKVIGGIMAKMFKDTNQITVDDFTINKAKISSTTIAGNDQTLNRYTFSLVKASEPATPA